MQRALPIRAADHGEYHYEGSGRLAGRRALITHGETGLGSAVAIAFAREGASVVITRSQPGSRDEAPGLALKNSGADVVEFIGDLTKPRFADGLGERTAATLGGIDVLVNGAPEPGARRVLEDLNRDGWETTFAATVGATLAVTRSVLPYLSFDAAIINTASSTGLEEAPTSLDYSAAMGAVLAITRSLALQLAPRGIRVNCVSSAPLWVPSHTGEVDGLLGAAGPSGRSPLGGAAQPVEVAPAYVHLASTESSFQTGSTIAVLGGRPGP